MTEHQIAIINGQGQPFEIKSVPTSSLAEDEVLIRPKMLAINPVDYAVKDAGFFVKSWPMMVGSDIAGEIVEVGSGLSNSNLKKGTRVLAAPLYLLNGKMEHAGFQELVVVPEVAVTVIPDSLSYEDASVLPLSVSTAASGLYVKEALGLELPSLNPKPTGKKLLIWGGSGSVGCSAVQLAVASGYEAIVTASEKNFEYVKSLAKPLDGKIKLYDYNSLSIVGDLVAQLGDECVGAFDAIGTQDTELQIATVLAQLGGGKIATVLPVPEGLPATVNSTMVFAVTIFGPHNDVGEAVFGKFLTEALAQQKFIAAPKPEVVGTGLGSLDDALKTHKAGVSAKKIVVAMK